MVLCVDEKTQIQALDRTAPILPLIPGTPERRTHDYKRNGTTNLYAALDVASGQRDRRHDRPASRRGVPAVLEPDRQARSPRASTCTSCWTTSSTHKTPSIQRWLVRHPRFTLHFTPTYSSVAEPRRAMVRRAHQPMAHAAAPTARVRELDRARSAPGSHGWNDDPKPFVWHKTADEILDTLANYCDRISDSGH